MADVSTNDPCKITITISARAAVVSIVLVATGVAIYNAPRYKNPAATTPRTATSDTDDAHDDDGRRVTYVRRRRSSVVMVEWGSDDPSSSSGQHHVATPTLYPRRSTRRHRRGGVDARSDATDERDDRSAAGDATLRPSEQRSEPIGSAHSNADEQSDVAVYADAADQNYGWPGATGGNARRPRVQRRGRQAEVTSKLLSRRRGLQRRGRQAEAEAGAGEAAAPIEQAHDDQPSADLPTLSSDRRVRLGALNSCVDTNFSWKRVAALDPTTHCRPSDVDPVVSNACGSDFPASHVYVADEDHPSECAKSAGHWIDGRRCLRAARPNILGFGSSHQRNLMEAMARYYGHHCRGVEDYSQCQLDGMTIAHCFAAYHFDKHLDKCFDLHPTLRDVRWSHIVFGRGMWDLMFNFDVEMLPAQMERSFAYILRRFIDLSKPSWTWPRLIFEPLYTVHPVNWGDKYELCWKPDRQEMIRTIGMCAMHRALEAFNANVTGTKADVQIFSVTKMTKLFSGPEFVCSHGHHYQGEARRFISQKFLRLFVCPSGEDFADDERTQLSLTEEEGNAVCDRVSAMQRHDGDERQTSPSDSACVDLCKMNRSAKCMCHAKRLAASTKCVDPFRLHRTLGHAE